MIETELEQLRRFNNQKAEALERAHDKLEHQENRVSELSAETEHLEKKVKLLVEALRHIAAVRGVCFSYCGCSGCVAGKALAAVGVKGDAK